jgi:FHA domain
MSDTPAGNKAAKPGGFLGSLKEALAAASRDDTGLVAANAKAAPAEAAKAALAVDAAAAGLAANASGDGKVQPPPLPSLFAHANESDAPKPMSAEEAARASRGVTSLNPPDRHLEMGSGQTTRIVRGGPKAEPNIQPDPVDPDRTQLVRGRQPLKRGQFVQDPVVGWLVIVGGPGLGAFRPVFEGNNTIGRSSTSRIPIDYGDEAISSDEQAYLRYDSNDRAFLFVPNMAKTNVVSVNNKRPTTAVELVAMDVITMGRTQLVFMPFCGSEFDWSEITETKD